MPAATKRDVRGVADAHKDTHAAKDRADVEKRLTWNEFQGAHTQIMLLRLVHSQRMHLASTDTKYACMLPRSQVQAPQALPKGNQLCMGSVQGGRLPAACMASRATKRHCQTSTPLQCQDTSRGGLASCRRHASCCATTVQLPAPSQKLQRAGCGCRHRLPAPSHTPQRRCITPCGAIPGFDIC